MISIHSLMRSFQNTSLYRVSNKTLDHHSLPLQIKRTFLSETPISQKVKLLSELRIKTQPQETNKEDDLPTNGWDVPNDSDPRQTTYIERAKEIRSIHTKLRSNLKNK